MLAVGDLKLISTLASTHSVDSGLNRFFIKPLVIAKNVSFQKQDVLDSLPYQEKLTTAD